VQEFLPARCNDLDRKGTLVEYVNSGTIIQGPEDVCGEVAACMVKYYT